MRAMSSSPVRSTPTPEPRANTITFISPQSALLARYMVTHGHHHDKRRTPHTAHTNCPWAQLFRVTCTRINETADMDMQNAVEAAASWHITQFHAPLCLAETKQTAGGPRRTSIADKPARLHTGVLMSVPSRTQGRRVWQSGRGRSTFDIFFKTAPPGFHMAAVLEGASKIFLV
jgi:hypothetical protein